MRTSKNFFTTIMFTLVLGCFILGSCSQAPSSLPTSTPTQIPTRVPTQTATYVPLPELTLNPGDLYFSMDGQQSLIFTRNTTGKTREDFAMMLDWAKQGGTKLIRVHLTSGWWGDPWINKDGTVDEKWAQDWDWLFDQAQQRGIYVIPVFGVWYDWNNNNIPNLSGGLWQFNPLNHANSGPVKEPGELFQQDSTTQIMWLAWVKTLVERWQDRKIIFAWEIFSEINFGSGAPGEADSTGAVTGSAALYLVNQAVDILQRVDTFHRPLTLSLAGIPWTGQWENFYRLNAIDFIQTHPYDNMLDKGLLTSVRNLLAEYNKPLMIGETGLSTMDTQSNASRGIQHAIWAGVVSGAMNSRALWAQDGVAFYTAPDRAFAIQYMQLYATAEIPAVSFVNGVDFTGFKPLSATSTAMVWGAAVGNEDSVLGWYRDATCEPPDWKVQSIPAGQAVTITIPGTSPNWQVDFYDTKTGTTILSSTTFSRQGDTVTVTLPAFQDDIAFKMVAKAGATPSTTAATSTIPAPTTTNSIAGNWSGTFSNQAGTFSAQIELSLSSDCILNQVCGTFSVPVIPCSGNLVLQAINNQTFIFVEQNTTGGTSCKSGALEWLTLQDDGSLLYEFLFSPGAAVGSSGTLNRK